LYLTHRSVAPLPPPQRDGRASARDLLSHLRKVAASTSASLSPLMYGNLFVSFGAPPVASHTLSTGGDGWGVQGGESRTVWSVRTAVV